MLVYHDFFYYSDPDQRFLKWIRIRPNDTNPTGSRPETLAGNEWKLMKRIENVCNKSLEFGA